MQNPILIHSELYCKGTASLNESLIEDFNKTDRSLKDLLDNESSENEPESGDGGSR